MALALSNQQKLFAAALAKSTGLNPYVVEAWMRNEEPAIARTVGQNDYNFLNIGNVDSGARLGLGDQVWANPVTAGQTTGAWLKGQNAVPGYGTASRGIQNILGSVGRGAAAQIAAIQGSGWATSGEPALPGLYAQATGGPVPTIPAGYKAPSGSLTAASQPGSASKGPNPANLQGLSTVSQPKATPVADMLSTIGSMGGDQQTSKTWDLLSNLAKAQGR